MKRALDAGDVGRQLVLAVLELPLHLCQLCCSPLESFGLGGELRLALVKGLCLECCASLELVGLDRAPLEGLLLGHGNFLGPFETGLPVVEGLLPSLQALVGLVLELL